MKKAILIVFFITISFAETSVLTSGGSARRDSSIQNDIKKLKIENNELKSRLDEQSQSIEGIRSVVDGDFLKIIKDLNRLKNQTNSKKSAKAIKKISQDIKKLRYAISKQNKNIAQLKSAITELASLIDGINNSYVRKEEFDSFKKESMEQKNRDLSRELLVGDQKYLFEKARNKFKQRKYEESEIIFKELMDTGYKPATVSYYLGEVNYYQKRYIKAIEYYKKSASLYNKSPFMPVLLLHSGISLEKTKNNKEAKVFFKSLMKNFPNTKSSKMAKKQLDRLK